MKGVCLTGVSRGLGRTKAELFFRFGLNIAVVSRSWEILREIITDKRISAIWAEDENSHNQHLAFKNLLALDGRIIFRQ
jgi:NADP-dependent 3-hydroxy acid dehydrogenase YdfG